MNNIFDIKSNKNDYEGKIILPAWIGFQSRHGFYCSKDSNEISNGLVYIDWQQDNTTKDISDQQKNAIDYLINNSEKIRDILLLALFDQIPELKEIYKDLMPEINKIEDLKNYIGLANIHIMEAHKEDFAYMGFEMGCNWDEEHGVGIMMHKDRVLEIGLAETSFDSWITFEDNGTAELELQKLNEAKKKSWWKFW